MIYFILGPQYHGVRLLSALLNHHPQILAMGRTNPARAHDERCSCGEKVSACEFWNHIKDSIPYEKELVWKYMMPSYPLIVENHFINKTIVFVLCVLAKFLGSGVWNISKKAKIFKETYEAYITACREWFYCDAIFDGENDVLKYMVCSTMDLPVSGVIHVRRDPRGFAKAYLEQMESRPLNEITKEWAKAHDVIQKRLKFFPSERVLAMKYEELLQKPQEYLMRFCKALGLEETPFLEYPIDARKNHMVGDDMPDVKNIREYIVDLRGKEKAWRETISGVEKSSIARVAGPLLGAFGYKE